MKTLCKSALLGAALCAAATAVSAQDIQRLNRPNPVPAIADATVVPPGFTTYYLSGALPAPIKPVATVHIHSLVAPGPLIEIEFTAAKKQ